MPSLPIRPEESEQPLPKALQFRVTLENAILAYGSAIRAEEWEPGSRTRRASARAWDKIQDLLDTYD